MAAVLACVLGGACAALADDDVMSHAVLAKPGGDALVIWDASTVVASIVKNKVADPDANVVLEHDALRVLAGMVPSLDKHLKSVTVRIIYSKIGAVSPVYGTPTFAGVERYATLTASGADALSDRDRWKELNEKAAIPAWFEYKLTGLLPPR
jgi:hypothetical protein